MFALGLAVYGTMRSGGAKHHKSYSFKATAGTSPKNGVLLTNRRGRPIAVKLPNPRGVCELRMASSRLGRSGRQGGHCWWGQLDFLKEKKRCLLNKAAYRELATDDLLPPILGRISQKHNLSPTFNWARYVVVRPTCNDVTVGIKHNFAKEIGQAKQVAAKAQNPAVKLMAVDPVKTWFGRYWGVDEGESWNESTYVQQHFFRTQDRGPYSMRVYTGNCRGYASTRKYNMVNGPTMTVAIYSDATDATPIRVGAIGLFIFLFVYVMARAEYFFSGD